MKAKKYFLLLAAGCMVLTAGGCGSSTEKENTETTEAAGEETEEEAAEETEETTEEAAEETTDETEEETTEETTEVGSDADETEPASEEASAESGTSSAAAADSEILADETVAGWHITVEGFKTDTSLQNASVELGYTGVESSNFEQDAEEGMKYCLIKLKIEKDGSKEVIDWENLRLTDGNNNTYTRIDDTFITDLGMKRMPGTALNFGSNEGWIAFEVQEDSNEFTLSYEFEGETFSCDLKS